MSVVTTVKDAIPSVTIPTVSIPSVDLPAPIEKPVYAFVGAGDLWVEKAKSAVDEVPALPGKVKTFVADTKTSTIKSEVKDLPETLKDLQSKLKANLTKDKAESFYADLATRGEKLVTKYTKKTSAKKPAAKKAPAVKKTA